METSSISGSDEIIEVSVISAHDSDKCVGAGGVGRKPSPKVEVEGEGEHSGRNVSWLTFMAPCFISAFLITARRFFLL